MLNPFPIQWLAMLAYLILRLVVGGILFYFGIRHIQYRHDLKHALSLSWFPYGLFSVWYLAAIELIIGAMFVLGLYTQIAALIAMLVSLKMIILNKRFASPYIPTRIFYVLLFATTLSLFITGGGAFAFDLPI